MPPAVRARETAATQRVDFCARAALVVLAVAILTVTADDTVASHVRLLIARAFPGPRSRAVNATADVASADPLPASPGYAEDCVMAVGDIHGDLEQAERALRLVGAVDASGAWSAGTCTLLQTGDIVDRGPASLSALKRFEELRKSAAAHGGRVETLLGNHELLNLQGDLRYVNRQELHDLAANVEAVGMSAAALESVPPQFWASVAHFPQGPARVGAAVWARLLQPKGWVGALLRARPAAVIAGSGACATLFVHAALLPEMLQAVLRPGDSPSAALQRLNEGVAEALAGCDGERECLSPYARGGPFGDATAAIFGGEGVFWARDFAESAVTSRCGGRLYLIDVGMSSVYHGGMGAWRCSAGKVETL